MLTWWSFTFPVGTCVTGAAALATHTGSVALAGLPTAWATVAVRMFCSAAVSGSLLARILGRVPAPP